MFRFHISNLLFDSAAKNFYYLYRYYII